MKKLILILLALFTCTGVFAQTKEDLMEAAKAGNVQGILELVKEAGIEVDSRDMLGRSALMIASKHGKTDAVAVLVELGAQVNLQDKNGRTAATYAAESGHTGTVVKLVELGADISIGNELGMDPLLFSAYYDHIDTFVRLVELGADVNSKNYQGRNCLMFAAKQGDTHNVEVMVGLGADPNSRDKRENTPLMEAAMMGRTETAAKLVELGADIDAVNYMGWTAFTYAEKHEHQATSDKLLELKLSKIQNGAREGLMQDSRSYLLVYIGEQAGLSDKQLVITAIIKIYDGLFSPDKEDCKKAMAVIVKQGVLDFMRSVRFEQEELLYLSYSNVLAVLKAVYDIFLLPSNDMNCTRQKTMLMRTLKEDMGLLRLEHNRLKGLMK